MLWDPPRREVPDAVHTAQRAGVRVVMITVDHPATAKAVAEENGISQVNVLTGAGIDALDPGALEDAVREATVFARVTPEHKLMLVEALSPTARSSP
jgi:Ca2+-transporting ATPase